MKFFRYGEQGNERPGVFDKNGIRRNISGVIEDLSGQGLSPSLLASLKNIELDAFPIVPDDVRIGACVGRVGNFIAVGLNYADHAAESGMPVPDEPILFNKAPSCIVGPDDDIILPPGSIKTDWEVEIAVVIGTSAFCISERDASQIIAGYCICNDVSERAYQLERGGQWTKGKGCPTFGPLGPWLVTPDEIENVQNLSMWLNVNGKQMQRGSTKTMVFSIDYLISYISQFMALQPGDVITTGTPPGVGLGMKPPQYLRAGDEIELGISSLGAQRQRVQPYSVG
jgi:2,4-didehydro-3-deoxy-L-rhamnonate hydrolase